MADQRLSIYNKKGVLRDRVSATISTTESLNDFGSAEFEMARRDPKSTAGNLHVGNYILFEHARLGNWGGVIASDSGQDWDDSDVIMTRALSAEYQFWRRRAPLYDPTSRISGSIVGTYGTLMKLLIRYANSKEDSLLRPGRIFMGEDKALIKLRYAMLGDLISHLLKVSGWDFWVTPYLENGLLRFGVNFMPRRGRDRGYVLRERINIERPGGTHHRRDGKLINDVVVLTESGEAPLKPHGARNSQQSIRANGLWQGVDSIEGDSEIGAQWTANQIIRNQSWPHEKDKIVAIESPESPSTFAYIPVGDVVTIQKDSAIYYDSPTSYTRQARIVSREYRSDVKKCILTMENDDE